MTRFERFRRLTITGIDTAVVCASIWTAYLLRFDFRLPPSDAAIIGQVTLMAVVSKLAAFWFFGCPRSTWRFFSLPDVRRLLAANAAGSAILALWIASGTRGAPLPSLIAMDFLVCTCFCGGARMGVRMFLEQRRKHAAENGPKRLLIYGVGETALRLLREAQSDPRLNSRVVGLIDANGSKNGSELMGVRVLGRGRDTAAIVEALRRRNEPVDEIVIAMPSATGRQMHEALANCHAAGLPCKTVPTLRDLLANEVLSAQLRNVRMEDLLGREAVQLDETLIRGALEGQSVMVSGGGGSIGSELCRQVASYHPERLVIFERSESDLFRIQVELARKFPSLRIEAELGDVREYDRIAEVLERHRVHSIYHAAAYKHVPMMETHVVEAIKNNVFGTHNLVNAAHAHSVRRFVMISSDKAVNPSSVMGATKRVAELIVSAMPETGEGGTTCFVSVRFGNVLGSNGSVVPLFEEQIRAGGPVTVTHPGMRRYFMTIPEAVQLVLQASMMGLGSEIFLLDMGEPVSIVEMARNMIRLSGKVPDEDIEIRFTGLRPGEKLFEELALDAEDVVPTGHQKIRIYKGPRRSSDEIESWLANLENMVAAKDEEAIRLHLRKLVPEYLPSRRPAAVETRSGALAAAAS